MAKPISRQRQLGSIEGEILMAKPAAEALCEEIRGGLRNIESTSAEVAVAVRHLKAGEGWRALGYGSWADCVDEEFHIGQRHGNRLAKYGEMILELTEAAGSGPVGPNEIGIALPERAFRDLPSEIAAGLPSQVAEAVKGKRGKNRVSAAAEVIAGARPDPKADVIVTERPTPTLAAPATALPGDESVGAPIATAQEPPAPAASPAPSSGPLKAALDLIAVTSVGELKACGFAKVRDAADRLAQADGRQLITADEMDRYRKVVREATAAALDAPPATRVRRPAAPSATSGDCSHPKDKRTVGGSGMAGCSACGAHKVADRWIPPAA